jgi:5'-methylthioadenosine phosphorylase
MSSSGDVSHGKHENNCSPQTSLIGVIGGSGIATLPGLNVKREERPATLYGEPSDTLLIGEYGGVEIAFLPRHGPKHTIPPHKIPYKANLAAFKSLGVRHVFATCVVGSLRKEFEPGSFVIPDQFIDMTWGRDDTFDQDRKLIHLPMTEPYCPNLSRACVEALKICNLPHHSCGTVVVIQGPRFSTKAESKVYAQGGGDIINMTQYPECYFARELGLCYATIASITDYNATVTEELSMAHIGTAAFDRVLEVFRRNTENTYKILAAVVQMGTVCNCADTQVHVFYEES